jgi:hypothetical protein
MSWAARTRTNSHRSNTRVARADNKHRDVLVPLATSPVDTRRTRGVGYGIESESKDDGFAVRACTRSAPDAVRSVATSRLARSTGLAA